MAVLAVAILEMLARRLRNVVFHRYVWRRFTKMALFDADGMRCLISYTNEHEKSRESLTKIRPQKRFFLAIYYIFLFSFVLYIKP